MGKGNPDNIRTWSKSYPQKYHDNIVLECVQRPAFRYSFTGVPNMHFLLSWEYGRNWTNKKINFMKIFELKMKRVSLSPIFIFERKAILRKLIRKATIPIECLHYLKGNSFHNVNQLIIIKRYFSFLNIFTK